MLLCCHGLPLSTVSQVLGRNLEEEREDGQQKGEGVDSGGEEDQVGAPCYPRVGRQSDGQTQSEICGMYPARDLMILLLSWIERQAASLLMSCVDHIGLSFWSAFHLQPPTRSSMTRARVPLQPHLQITDCFRDRIGSFVLPFPGSKVASKSFNGEISKIDGGFRRLVRYYIETVILGKVKLQDKISGVYCPNTFS